MKHTTRMRHTLYIYIAVATLLLSACGQKAEVPAQFAEADGQANIYPDYKDVVVPPNIAPLNFIVRDSAGTGFVVRLEGGGQTLVAGSADGTVRMDTTQWRALLTASKGRDVSVDVFAKHPEGWLHFKPHTFHVAQEPIDPFLSYRLIEPGYELYRQIGLYQRNLTTFDEVPIYENNREYADGENHCVNCHNFQQNSAQKMLFHVRANHGGTIFVSDGKARKVIFKDSTILSSAVYPSWHPTENLVAFSTNKTGQAFHLYHPEKLEVMDEASDLLLYDLDSNRVSHIIRTTADMETFPCWSADGRTLFYCSANRSRLLDPSLPDSLAPQQLLVKFDSIRYNLMSIPFDPATRRFGTPRLEVDAAAEGKSISVPRVSPDGRFVLFTLGDYGQFHIWHRSSDLWVKDLRTDSLYALTDANSPDVDSFHSWSSNSRWFVFSSRRMDGNYTRPFIAYFDEQGHAHKPFVLPQEDPEWNILLLKSYNVPELSRDAVGISTHELRQCIYDTEGDLATYEANPTAIVRLDATTGASPKASAVDGTSGASQKK